MKQQNILLIHGWASDERIWQGTQKYLAHWYRVYTCNLPLAQNNQSYAEGVIKFITEKSLTQVILMGWSMGTLVAIQVAHQLAYQVQGLVLISGTSRFVVDSQPGGIPSSLVRRMKRKLNQNGEQTINDFYKLMFSQLEQTQGLAKKTIATYLRGKWGGDVAKEQAGLDFLMEADVREILRKITCRTLLVHGEQDEICPIDGARFIQQQVADARLISYSQIGHIPFLTNFKVFHRDVREWLANYGSK